LRLQQEAVVAFAATAEDFLPTLLLIMLEESQHLPQQQPDDPSATEPGRRLACL
jgi:hypothetical protein